MSCTIVASDEGFARLTGELCIFNAAELKDQLLGLINPGSSRTVNLAGISEIDSAGIQLLLLAKREAAAKGCTLQFTNHSEPLVEAITLLNLSQEFGDPLLLTKRAAGGL